MEPERFPTCFLLCRLEELDLHPRIPEIGELGGFEHVRLVAMLQNPWPSLFSL